MDDKKQATSDLRDTRGGAYDADPAERAKEEQGAPSSNSGPATPEGLRRERKGPLNKNTGRG